MKRYGRLNLNRAKYRLQLKDWKFILLGLLFALLWSSASTATKIGLEVAQPFVIALTRFLIAGLTMIIITHLLMKKRLPQRKEWLQLTIYGILNITGYLGFYVIAMQNVSAGFGSLAVATNPVFIALLASIFFKYKLPWITVFSMLICFIGVALVAYPLMQSNLTTFEGIAYMLGSMISYSIGTLYYSRQNWTNLPILTINGWQTLIGGFFLIPFLLYSYNGDHNVYDLKFWLSVSWLAFPVSIAAVLLWLFLLKINPLKASYWLFLCPIFGFFIARIFVKEPITLYTSVGVVLVIIGLFLLNRKKTVETPIQK